MYVQDEHLSKMRQFTIRPFACGRPTTKTVWKHIQLSILTASSRVLRRSGCFINSRISIANSTAVCRPLSRCPAKRMIWYLVTSYRFSFWGPVELRGATLGLLAMRRWNGRVGYYNKLDPAKSKTIPVRKSSVTNSS